MSESRINVSILGLIDYSIGGFEEFIEAKLGLCQWLVQYLVVFTQVFTESFLFQSLWLRLLIRAPQGLHNRLGLRNGQLRVRYGGVNLINGQLRRIPRDGLFGFVLFLLCLLWDHRLGC